MATTIQIINLSKINIIKEVINNNNGKLETKSCSDFLVDIPKTNRTITEIMEEKYARDGSKSPSLSTGSGISCQKFLRSESWLRGS